jgi:hypothetical protein
MGMSHLKTSLDLHQQLLHPNVTSVKSYFDKVSVGFLLILVWHFHIHWTASFPISVYIWSCLFHIPFNAMQYFLLHRVSIYPKNQSIHKQCNIVNYLWQHMVGKFSFHLFAATLDEYYGTCIICRLPILSP